MPRMLANYITQIQDRTTKWSLVLHKSLVRKIAKLRRSYSGITANKAEMCHNKHQDLLLIIVLLNNYNQDKTGIKFRSGVVNSYSGCEIPSLCPADGPRPHWRLLQPEEKEKQTEGGKNEFTKHQRRGKK